MAKKSESTTSGEAREPQPTEIPSDRQNTPPGDLGFPTVPVKDIANGLASPPDLPDLPYDHPEFDAVQTAKLARQADELELQRQRSKDTSYEDEQRELARQGKDADGNDAAVGEPLEVKVVK